MFGLLPTGRRLTYIHLLWYEKFLLRNEQKLALLERLSQETRRRMDLEVFHYGMDVLQRSIGEDVMLMVQGAGFFIKIHMQTSQFCRATFLKAAKLVLTPLLQRAQFSKLVSGACLLAAAWACEVASNAGSIHVCKATVSEHHACFLLQLPGYEETLRRNSYPSMRLTALAEKSPVR